MENRNKKKYMKKIQKLLTNMVAFIMLLNTTVAVPVAHAAIFQLVDNESRIFPAESNTFDHDVSITETIDVDGTSNLDDVDIDGNTQADGTVTVGVNDTGYDVKFFGATSGKYLEWDESADQLNANGIIQAMNGNPVRFGDGDNSHYASIQAPDTIAISYDLYLPDDDGDADEVLTTNGSGGLSWAFSKKLEDDDNNTKIQVEESAARVPSKVKR